MAKQWYIRISAISSSIGTKDISTERYHKVQYTASQMNDLGEELTKNECIQWMWRWIRVIKACKYVQACFWSDRYTAEKVSLYAIY